MSQEKLSSKKRKIKTFLQNNICTVKFTKANGDERKMLCTLVEQFLPAKYTNTDNPVDFVPTYSDEAIPVWDLEKKDWRAFRYDSITEMRIKTGKMDVRVFPEDDQ